MNHSFSSHPRSWDVFLIGGASGTGKTSVSYRFAHHFGAGLTEVDDLHLAVHKMTTPEQQPLLHYWHTHPEALEFSAEKILELHLAVGRVMRPALEAVIADHLESRTAVVLEGDYLLPELLAQQNDGGETDAGRVGGVFLYEPEETQLLRNFASREPEEGEQTKRARVSWLYGEWLRAECARYGLTALPARPWESLLDRILASI